MHVLPEIEFQISLLNISSLGTDQPAAQELEELLEQQTAGEKR